MKIEEILIKEILIKIKRLESKKDLRLLTLGNVVIISVKNVHENYHGPAVFIGKMNYGGEQWGGFDFCRPKHGSKNWAVAYHLNEKEILITEKGIISSHDFWTYMCGKPEYVKKSGLI